ncbi:histidine-type phosphatase [Janthinobacterium sp. PAMC25594]|uniref:histidine-type phosphatase n=1 Tax=Janthinobacterium sp. PAMC25594 TaxID=2861284 RepID=UPI001C632A34|nr:histidine-type phosphatase [Janthinobacterium sp. PAMC25594]QYG05982.1 histidine phosphatase family protein [Janthinobacterium sp. PAMC25594]
MSPPFPLSRMLLALACCASPALAFDGDYQTKTPYAPQQDPATYAAPPAGFQPIFTQLVARHGSRGLTGMKGDAALYAMWRQAAAQDALTPLGRELGADILALMRANALLGHGVAGIESPGYGNLTQTGIDEHRQLAARLLARLPTLFAQVGQDAATAPRQLVTIHSGVDRARDSARFFTQSLLEHAPALAPLLTLPPAPAPYPQGRTPAVQPILQADGVNRFLLYAHKLAPRMDLVADRANPYFTTYAASQAYQRYERTKQLHALMDAPAREPAAAAHARHVLERLFTPAFLAQFNGGATSYADTGSYTFTSADGKLTRTITGSGKTVIRSPNAAATKLYELYAIAAGMRHEVPADFSRYMPAEDARYYASVADHEDFYQKGPATTESSGVTWRFALALREDFFNEVDALAAGDLRHAAKLRFTHAEMIIPLASAMGLQQPLPASASYSYDTNPWRGESVSPLAANMQWDVYRNGDAQLIVRLLYNEKETPFQPACDSARIAPGSVFYDYTGLKACYGHAAAQ